MTDAKRHYLAGLKRFGLNDFAGAIAEYAKALEFEPESPDVLNALATAHSRAGDHVEAERVIRQAIDLAPSDAFAYTSLSIFLQRQGKIPEAEAAAAKARMINWREELKRNPNAPPPQPPGGMKTVS